MKSVFNLFIATKELYTSPYIQLLRDTHDVELLVGETKVVSFMLPAHKLLNDDDMEISFDPHMVDIENAACHTSFDPSGGTFMVTLTIRPIDMGTTEISFIEPKKRIFRKVRKSARV